MAAYQRKTDELFDIVMARSHQMELDTEKPGDGVRDPSPVLADFAKAWYANFLRQAVPGPDIVGVKGVDGAFAEKGLIDRVEERGDLVIFEDGYTYYCPTGGGGLTAHNLRIIADELDRRNAPVDEWYRRSV